MDIPVPPYAPPAPRRALLDLFLVSFTILFFELTCIRWFASTVIFLTFFTNLVLMACFLGMSVGCLTASRRFPFVRAVIPLALTAVATALAVAWAYNHYGQFAIDVGSQRSPQVVYFGTEYRAKDPSKFLIPVEAVAGVFFVLIAGMFIGLGQALGRAFNAVPDRVAAYSADLVGSLAGIGAFALASSFNTTPHLWFAVSALLCLYLARPVTFWLVGCQTVLLLLVAVSAYGLDEKRAEDVLVAVLQNPLRSADARDQRQQPRAPGHARHPHVPGCVRAAARTPQARGSTAGRTTCSSSARARATTWPPRWRPA